MVREFWHRCPPRCIIILRCGHIRGREKSDAAICNKVAHFATLVAGGRRRYSISLRLYGDRSRNSKFVASSTLATTDNDRWREHSRLSSPKSLSPPVTFKEQLAFLALQNQLWSRPLQKGNSNSIDLKVKYSWSSVSQRVVSFTILSVWKGQGLRRLYRSTKRLAALCYCK